MLASQTLPLRVPVALRANDVHAQRLIELHAEHPDALVEAGITKDERNMLTGALEYSHKVVSDVMTTIDNVYMIEASTKVTPSPWPGRLMPFVRVRLVAQVAEIMDLI